MYVLLILYVWQRMWYTTICSIWLILIDLKTFLMCIVRVFFKGHNIFHGTYKHRVLFNLIQKKFGSYERPLKSMLIWFKYSYLPFTFWSFLNLYKFSGFVQPFNTYMYMFRLFRFHEISTILVSTGELPNIFFRSWNWCVVTYPINQYFKVTSEFKSSLLNWNGNPFISKKTKICMELITGFFYGSSKRMLWRFKTSPGKSGNLRRLQFLHNKASGFAVVVDINHVSDVNLPRLANGYM